jgi:TatD DNase family protein
VNPFPFIDIHTHQVHKNSVVVQVLNLMPGDPVPVFTGRNFYSAGLHPWKLLSAEENNDRLLMLEDALELDQVIFVGECGLDKLSNTDYQEQIRVFKAQVFMAEEYQKPLIIHCVKSWNEVLEIYKTKHPSVPWIFHGFNGHPELIRQFSGDNIWFSFGEWLLKGHAKAIESLKILPLEKVFFETDVFDGSVGSIYEKAAEIMKISVESLKESIWENFNRIENVSFPSNS